MTEEWKPIIIEKNGVVYDYTGLYEVSSYGRIRSMDRTVTTLNNGTLCERKIKGRIKLPHIGKDYLQITLSKHGSQSTFLIHRLVAAAFLSNPDNLPMVNHKNENKLDNHVDNLEWCTREYNVKYSSHKISKSLKGRTFTDEHKQKISKNHADFTGSKNPRAKKVLCVETGQVFDYIKDAEVKTGVNAKNIGACCNGKRKTAGGYHWMYLEDYLAQQENVELLN